MGDYDYFGLLHKDYEWGGKQLDFIFSQMNLVILLHEIHVQY